MRPGLREARQIFKVTQLGVWGGRCHTLSLSFIDGETEALKARILLPRSHRWQRGTLPCATLSRPSMERGGAERGCGEPVARGAGFIQDPPWAVHRVGGCSVWMEGLDGLDVRELLAWMGPWDTDGPTLPILTAPAACRMANDRSVDGWVWMRAQWVGRAARVTEDR